MSGFTSILNIAGSAMSAQDVRLNTIASNLANADSVTSSEATTYRARKPVFAAVMAENSRGVPDEMRVQVLGIVEENEPLQMEYNPGHPLANDKGYVCKPNINKIREMTDMLEASRAYQLSAELSTTAKELALQTIKAGG